MSIAVLWGLGHYAVTAAGIVAAWYLGRRSQISVLYKAAQQLGVLKLLDDLVAEAKAQGVLGYGRGK